MKSIKNKKDWITIPVLPSISIEATLSFWELLGYTITYKQTRPYQYGVVKRGDYELHFGGTKLKEANQNSGNGCLVMVSDIDKVYEEFTRKLKLNLGRVPHSGIPRISRKKPEATRFTLTDLSGNWIIFINYGEEDQKTWEKADEKDQSPLKIAIAIAIRYRDYKEDEKAAAAILDVAMRKTTSETQMDIAEALIIRIDLANLMNEPLRVEECRNWLKQVKISDEDLKYLAKKHQVEL